MSACSSRYLHRVENGTNIMFYRALSSTAFPVSLAAVNLAGFTTPNMPAAREMCSEFATEDGMRENDIFRDSILRYSAFTSDLGESFKPSRRLYLLSYGVVAAYGLADTVDKGRKAYVYSLPSSFGGASGSSYGGSVVPGGPPVALSGSARGMARSVADAVCLAQQAASQRQLAGSAREQQSLAVPVAAAVLDSAVFHGVASLAIPAVMINRAVWGTGKLLARFPRLPPRVRAFGPSAVGLALIPLAVPHIDEGVSRWMDAHVRPRLNLPENSQTLAGLLVQPLVSQEWYRPLPLESGGLAVIRIDRRTSMRT